MSVEFNVLVWLLSFYALWLVKKCAPLSQPFGINFSTAMFTKPILFRLGDGRFPTLDGFFFYLPVNVFVLSSDKYIQSLHCLSLL